jgi:hypothetical protein
MILGAKRLTALLTVLGFVLAGCGSSGGSSPTPTVIPTTGPAAKKAVVRVTHANPFTLLPTASQVARLIKPVSRPSRYDETLSSSTLSSAFASEVPRAMRLASGTSELDVTGAHGKFLYAHVFVFRTLAGAASLTPTFLRSTRLGRGLPRPSGSPGRPGMASGQPYGNRHDMSYRYAFRDGNVLAYVELDGPRHRYSAAKAASVAAIIDKHISTAVGG